MEIEESQIKTIKEIPTLTRCIIDKKTIPNWEDVVEGIYQSEKALFLLKKIAEGFYPDLYRWKMPDSQERMKREGVQINQQVPQEKRLR